MSKPVKNLVINAYKRRFGGITGAVLINIRGINANDNSRLRAGLAAKQIKMAVVKNKLARRAFEGTELVPLADLLDGPTAVVYPVNDEASVVTVARELVDWAAGLGQLEFKGALMEGTVFGPDRITELSRYPTRDEAHAQAVQIVLSPGQNLIGSILGPGRKLASLVKAIEEKLEKGEAIKG